MAGFLRSCVRMTLCFAVAALLSGITAPTYAVDDEHAHDADDSGHHAHGDGSGHDHDASHDHDEGDGHAHADDDSHGHDHGDENGHGQSGEHGHGEHASHAGHGGPASNHPLSVDPDLAIVTLIVFLVLLIVLHKFAWGPIIAGIQKREQAVAGDIEEAEARQQQAEKMLDDYQRQLERAGDEVRAMLEGAKKEAESMKQAIVEEAHKAAAAQKDQATSEIEAAKSEAISEIAGESVNIAFRVASGALQRDVNPADHQELIAEAGLKN